MPSPAIEAAAAESGVIRAALEMAEREHAGQTRNGSGGMAYIHHPVAVAELLAAQGFDDETVAAALLHDVVEDSDTGVGDVRERFGERVGGLVEALTDDESIEPYVRRKDLHRQQVAAAGGDAPAIYGADKLSNISVLRRTYAEQGEKVGDEFEAPLDVKEAVWRADLEMLRREAPQLPFLDQLEAELDALKESRGRRVRADLS
jgi:(p)ppGpp synthase/HD superfamily hydrolase